VRIEGKDGNPLCHSIRLKGGKPRRMSAEDRSNSRRRFHAKTRGEEPISAFGGTDVRRVAFAIPWPAFEKATFHKRTRCETALSTLFHMCSHGRCPPKGMKLGTHHFRRRALNGLIALCYRALLFMGWIGRSGQTRKVAPSTSRALLTRQSSNARLSAFTTFRPFDYSRRYIGRRSNHR